MAFVLVVDDDRDGREVLCRLLENAGHEVVCASNGREAVTAILARMPDVAIVDLLMPEMHGIDLVDVLRSYVRLQSLPVIILTAYRESPLLDRARELNVSSILTKGKANLREILNAVNAAIACKSPPPVPPDSTGYFTGA